MKIIKNTAIISIITFISRCFGYVRDVVIASAIGTGPLNDALIAAWRFSNLFRSLFAEGALTAAFVPIFSGALANNDRNAAIRLASSVFSLLSIIVVLFSIVIILFMPYVMALITPGFTESDAMFHTAVDLARITFPYLLFISLAALYGCVLSSIGKFAPFASTSIIFNIVIIFFVVYCDKFPNKAFAVAYGILCAGIIEWLWMLLCAYRYNMLIPIQKHRMTPEIQLLFKRMVAGIVGSGVYHISIWIDMIIVSFVAGGMSYLYYADRVMQLPLAIIATAASTTLLPALSQSIATQEHEDIHNLSNTSLKFTMYFLIPIALSSIYFAYEIIEVLFERGAFDTGSTAKTAEAFAVLAAGLPAFAMVKLFSSTFYARGKVSTPVKITIVALVINTIISLSLLQWLQHVGVALGSTIAAWINASVLFVILQRKNYYKVSRSVIAALFAYVISAIVALCLMIFAHHRLYNDKYIDSLLVFLFGAMVYVGVCHIVMQIFQHLILSWKKMGEN